MIRHLATGGMGEVWSAEARGAAGFAKRLVIKTLRPELASDARLVDQLVVEGRLLEALDHPNIAQILDLGHVDGTWFLAIEMVQGFDLRALRRALPERDGRQCLGEVAVLAAVSATASALHHAATRLGDDGKPLAIVHHDVTPSNLMVRRDGLVKLVDFGVARSALMAHLEQSSLRGKLPYMAPEHLDSTDVDGRADLFSLGLCAYELLTGQRAMDVADAPGLPAAWASLPARVAALSALGVSARTQALIAAMTARDRAKRPQDAGVVVREVAQLLLALGEASPERVLAAELASAFDRLEAEERGIDATLMGILEVDGRAGVDSAGTLSLPGLTFGTPAPGTAPLMTPPSSPANPALGETPLTPPARPRRTVDLRRRTFAGLAAALLLAGTIGWWLGAGDRSDDGRASASVGDGVIDSAVDNDAVAGPAVVVMATGGATAIADAGGPNAAFGPSLSVVASQADAPADAAAVVAVKATDEAVAEAGGVTPTSADKTRASSGRATAGKPLVDARRTEQRATIKFRVMPSDVEVVVDGRKVDGGPGLNGVYTLRLPLGRRRIEVRDRTSGETQRRELDVIGESERTLEAFVFVRGLP